MITNNDYLHGQKYWEQRDFNTKGLLPGNLKRMLTK